MHVVGVLIQWLASLLDSVGGLFQWVALLFHSLLPAVLPPDRLIRLIRAHYDRSYRNAYDRFTVDVYEWALEGWEQEALDSHGVVSGTILVLGAGVGRESIALAKRGLTVIGLDINREALLTASQMAR